MISHFAEPIFRAWLSSAMDTNTIPIPLARFDKFSDNLEFRARGFAWVDPAREMSAAIMGISNGILSMQDVSNQYGRDVTETLDQIQLEKQMAEERGINIAFEPFGGGQSAYGPIKISPEDLVDGD
jgi:capsid protein